MTYSDELLAVAKRIFWFGTAEEALEFPVRFLTYAMTYAADDDIEIVRNTSLTTISKPRCMTPPLGFSTKALGPNGIDATGVLRFLRFRSDGFPEWIPLQSPISFPLNPEDGDIAVAGVRGTRADLSCRVHQSFPFL
jgi:hypothetical protein